MLALEFRLQDDDDPRAKGLRGWDAARALCIGTGRALKDSKKIMQLAAGQSIRLSHGYRRGGWSLALKQWGLERRSSRQRRSLTADTVPIVMEGGSLCISSLIYGRWYVFHTQCVWHL